MNKEERTEAKCNTCKWGHGPLWPACEKCMNSSSRPGWEPAKSLCEPEQDRGLEETLKDCKALHIRWSPPGEISESGCWTAWESCFLYTAQTLDRLWQVVVSEWRDDAHLVG
jgi:hypothetical protein